MDPANVRAFYRLVYPRFLRPVLQVGDARFAVVDASERGLRYLAPGPPSRDGLEVRGILYLPEARPIMIEGTVIRCDPPHVALALAQGIPFGVMLEQQRLLQQRVLA